MPGVGVAPGAVSFLRNRSNFFVEVSSRAGRAGDSPSSEDFDAPGCGPRMELVLMLRLCAALRELLFKPAKEFGPSVAAGEDDPAPRMLRCECLLWLESPGGCGKEWPRSDGGAPMRLRWEFLVGKW